MKKPAHLKPGDTIGICAPARKVTIEELTPGIQLFESWGLKVLLSKHCLGSNHQFSGTDEERTDDLQALLDDKKVKAIIGARGGYGCIRIIDHLDFSCFNRGEEKWIIGFSDLTILHSHLQNNLGFCSLHAPMVFNFHGDRYNEAAAISLHRALMQGEIDYQLPVNNDQQHNIHGYAEGELVGGNLSILASLLGSKTAKSTAGKILFIEDLDEYLYHIDRLMHQLDRAGHLKQLKGLIVGGMSDMKDNTIPFGTNTYQIIHSMVRQYNFPVCFDFPSGHIQKNLSLILGDSVALDVKEGHIVLKSKP